MKIMVGYNKSEEMRPVLEAAKRHAVAFDADVILATSLIISTLDEEQVKKRAQRELESAKSYFVDNGISCETQVIVRGLSEGEDLVNYANNQLVDEIIVGTRKRSKLGKMIMGSVAQDVILNASCPVLLVNLSTGN